MKRPWMVVAKIGRKLQFGLLSSTVLFLVFKLEDVVLVVTLMFLVFAFICFWLVIVIVGFYLLSWLTHLISLDVLGTCRTPFHPICARGAKHRMEIWGKTGFDNVSFFRFTVPLIFSLFLLLIFFFFFKWVELQLVMYYFYRLSFELSVQSIQFLRII